MYTASERSSVRARRRARNPSVLPTPPRPMGTPSYALSRSTRKRRPGRTTPSHHWPPSAFSLSPCPTQARDPTKTRSALSAHAAQAGGEQGAREEADGDAPCGRTRGGPCRPGQRRRRHRASGGAARTGTTGRARRACRAGARRGTSVVSVPGASGMRRASVQTLEKEGEGGEGGDQGRTGGYSAVARWDGDSARRFAAVLGMSSGSRFDRSESEMSACREGRSGSDLSASGVCMDGLDGVAARLRRTAVIHMRRGPGRSRLQQRRESASAEQGQTRGRLHSVHRAGEGATHSWSALARHGPSCVLRTNAASCGDSPSHAASFGVVEQHSRSYRP